MHSCVRPQVSEPVDITFLEHDVCHDHHLQGGRDPKSNPNNHSMMIYRKYGDTTVVFLIYGGKRAYSPIKISGGGWEVVGEIFKKRTMELPDAYGYSTFHSSFFYKINGDVEKFFNDFTMMNLIADRGRDLETPGVGNMASAKHFLYFNEEDYVEALAQNKNNI